MLGAKGQLLHSQGTMPARLHTPGVPLYRPECSSRYTARLKHVEMLNVVFLRDSYSSSNTGGEGRCFSIIRHGKIYARRGSKATVYRDQDSTYISPQRESPEIRSTVVPLPATYLRECLKATLHVFFTKLVPRFPNHDSAIDVIPGSDISLGMIHTKHHFLH